jgi:hypothetical protein
MRVASHPPRETQSLWCTIRNAAAALVQPLRCSWNAFQLERTILKDAERELNEAGIWRSPTRHYAGHLTIALLILFLLVAVRVGSRWYPQVFASEGTVLDLTAGIIGFGALLLGLQQFRLARNEVSLDKFYDRLDVTNRRLEECEHARPLVDCWEEDEQDDDRTFARKMYVYREIDNLEYAIAKYRIGFMSPDNAYRALRTFRARCDPSRDFCKIALNALGDLRGYDPQTVKAVIHLCMGSSQVKGTSLDEVLRPVRMASFTPLCDEDFTELRPRTACEADPAMSALLDEIVTGRPVRVPLVDGQSARGLRVAVSRAAGRRGMKVVTLEGEGFVAVKKADSPPIRNSVHRASEPGKRQRRPRSSVDRPNGRNRPESRSVSS